MKLYICTKCEYEHGCASEKALCCSETAEQWYQKNREDLLSGKLRSGMRVAGMLDAALKHLAVKERRPAKKPNVTKKPLPDKKTDKQKNLENEIFQLKAEAAELVRDKESLAAQASYLIETLREQAGPVRSYLERCPDLKVGRFVLGNKIYGRVKAVLLGGGVWQGQELAVVDGYKGVIPSNRLTVV